VKKIAPRNKPVNANAYPRMSAPELACDRATRSMKPRTRSAIGMIEMTIASTTIALRKTDHTS